MTKIIGLILVKNEDIHIEWVIRNVIDFCDKIYICDNYSSDGTWEIIARLEREFSNIETHRVHQAKESHRFIEKYAGTKTWVFAVDGDEIYDSRGLLKLKTELLDGVYDAYFKLVGNTLHADKIDREGKETRGYLAPPAKNVTKLYNFNAVLKWNNPPYERLHGGEIVFREGYQEDRRFLFDRKYDWDSAYYRCLHACFVRRSSEESEKEIYARLIPDERESRGSFWKALWERLSGYDPGLEKAGPSNWKMGKYAVGEKVIKRIDSF
ncbi:MAG: glycosyltransferase family 2 protein [Verrucomicrobiota bacterium]